MHGAIPGNSVGSNDDSTFGSLVEAWLGGLGSENTRTAYAADVAAFRGWCVRSDALPLRITMEDVVAYQEARVSAGDSPSTIRRRNSSLSSLFELAVQRGAIETNPVVGDHRPRVAVGDPSPTPALSPRAIESAMRAAENTDARLHALVALLALEGLKLHEAIALDVDHVTGTGSRLSVAVARRSDTQLFRLRAESTRAVRSCVGGRRQGPLLVGRSPADPGTTRLTRFGADHLLKRLPAAPGESFTANSLRRYYVASAHAAGQGLDEIRRRAGLADLRGARRYVRSPNNQPADRGSSQRPTEKEE